MRDSLMQRSVPNGGMDAVDSAADTRLALYRWMAMARRIDAVEREWVARGEAHFHVGCAGHEASAALAPALLPADYLHCHYRDKALMLARGLPVREFFDSLVGNAAGHSAGRQMSAHLSSPALHILSLPGPVGNNALQAVGVAQQIRQQTDKPIVLCSMGDGTTQQGEVLEAIAEAVRSHLPVLFLVHDNQWAISTPTRGRTFFSLPWGDSASFYGLPIHRLDGRDALTCQQAFAGLVRTMRRDRGPVLCVMNVDRLCDHTNADDQAVYRDPAVTAANLRTGDPVLRLRAMLAAERGPGRMDEIDEDIARSVDLMAGQALRADRWREPVPEPSCTVGERAVTNEPDEAAPPGEVTMAATLRDTLRARMSADARITLYGQDIEDPKGDVFGVTRGLTRAFPGRVHNAPLSESTIVGTSIGRALAGGRPVAFLQFADFLPLAFNQLASELASITWRTCGGWRTPVVVMAACGGYRPGLGPFHSSSFESVMAHLSGVDVALPANASDAAGMLNAAFDSERPTVLFYPKALLHDRAVATTDDGAARMVPRGRARVCRTGDALSFVAWGNTVALCERAADTLAAAGHPCDVIDLRWLAPWDRATVIASARKTHRVVVVHEDSHSVGFGAEVVATVNEALPQRVTCRRVCRADGFLPSRFDLQLALLPSYRRVIDAACELLDLPVVWSTPPLLTAGAVTVPVQGASPADHMVEIVELNVSVGMHVAAGQTIACVEADKAAAEQASPCAGTVSALHAKLGDRVAVGAPLMCLSTSETAGHLPMTATDDVASIGLPSAAPRAARTHGHPQQSRVNIVGLGRACGRDTLDNDELARHLVTAEGRAERPEDLFARTGIRSRRVADATQNVVSMAIDAATAALREADIAAADLALVICSTSTARQIAPSTACEVLAALAPGAVIPAYDLAAACSGYLYALANAWDFLQQHPDAHVLVVSSEVMRSAVQITDPAASPVFGDAATATVLSNAVRAGSRLARLHRPVLGALGDGGRTMRLPLAGSGKPMEVRSATVLRESVRRMSEVLVAACAGSRLTLSDLSMVVPQQANGRVIEALRLRMRLSEDRIWNEVHERGNTSSSAIPLALDTVLRQAMGKGFIGICAFGAGLTFGAAVLEVNDSPTAFAA